MEHQDEQEKLNGTGDPAITGSGGSVLRTRTVLKEVAHTPFDSLPEPAVTAAVSILSGGAVLCVLAFIILSFVYPDRMSTAIGALVPIVTLLLQHWQNRRRK